MKKVLVLYYSQSGQLENVVNSFSKDLISSSEIDITIKLKRYFPLTEKPLIIINAGGFSAAGFLS